MNFSHWKANTQWRGITMFLLPILLLLLYGCGNSPAPSQVSGQQLLAKVAHNFTTANTLHASFNVSITGQTGSQTMKSEVWKVVPSKNRTVVLQSSLAQYAGTTLVTNGKQEWLYKPASKIVYTGLVPSSANTGTNTSGSTNPTGQGLSPLYLVQQALTSSDAPLNPSSATVGGHAVDDVHIVSKPGSGQTQYTGEVYIDKTTQLPVQIILNFQDAGNGMKEVIDIPTLTLNQAIPDSIFTFTPPSGTRVASLPPPSTTNSITLARAQQQAGYHLLSVPASKTNYVSQGVYILGSTGHEIYEIDYASGDLTFAIDEGKSLADPSAYPGTPVNVRGKAGTFSTDSGGVTTLFWIENGVGITITGSLNKSEIIGIAQMLA